MSSDSRRRLRRQLEQELQSKPLQAKLAILQTEFPIFGAFATWLDVVDTLHNRAITQTAKDNLLRALLWVRQRERDADWNVVLTVVFWPALNSIYRKKYEWDSDVEELWYSLYSVFLEVLNRIDVFRRPDRLAAKVFNDTLHALYRLYHRKWECACWEIRLDPEIYDALVECVAGDGAAAIESQAELALQLRRLRRLRQKGILTSAEFDLLVAVDFDGQSLAELASKSGANYQTLKKRRQRALAKIKREEKKILAEDFLSPKVGRPGLSRMGGVV